MINNIIGAATGVQLVNGKFRPKYGVIGILSTIFYIIVTIGAIIAFIYGIISLNMEFIVVPGIGTIAMVYLLLVNPYLQRSKNYYIKFQAENTLYNFELYYKNKKVNIAYKIDQEGKFAYLNNNKKLECLSYADGSPMSNITKYKIINYFTKWLSTNHLLSKETTVTFEKL